MKNELNICVIIPVFNGEKFVIKNIQSLKTQSYEIFEAIYIDDGSTDKSIDILNRECANDSRFRWYSKPNEGIARTLKFGLQQATSEFIVLLDQDDIAMPNRLELTVDAFKRGAELIMGSYEIVDETSQSTGKIIRLPDFITSENILLEQLKRSYILGSALAFKNKHDFSFLESSGGATDYDISLKMLLNGYRFEYIPEVLIKYRVHQNNTSANYRNQKRDITSVIEQYTPGKLESKLRNRGYINEEIYLALGILYLFQDKYNLANTYLTKAINVIEKDNERYQKELYFYMGVLQYKIGSIINSIESFEALLRKYKNPSITNNCGYFKILLGDFKQAESLFRQALNFNGDYMDASLNLNECIKGSTDIHHYRFTTRLLRDKLTHKIISN